MINNKLLNIETMKKLFLFFYLSVVSIAAFAAEQFVIFTPAGNHFPLVANGVPCPIYIDSSEDKGVMIAAGNLQQDILQVCGKKARTLNKHKFETVYHCRYLWHSFYKEADVSRQNRQKGIGWKK